MPMPIRPSGSLENSNESNYDFNNYFPLNLDDNFLTSSIKKEAMANDTDADILFGVWKNSTVLSNSDKVENKIYKLNKNVDSKDIMRLKASGLIVGERDSIKITSKGAAVIKTLVLGEPNSFGKKSVKKPYSVILAEQKSPKRKSSLALASKKESDFSRLNDLLKFSRDAEDNLSGKPFVWNERLVSRGIASDKSDKEYNVRIYRNDNNEFEVWVFYGRTNGNLTPEKVRTTTTLDNAESIAIGIVNKKHNGSSHYNPATEYGLDKINNWILGINETGVEKATTQPVQQPAKTKEEKSNNSEEIYYDENAPVDETLKKLMNREIYSDKIKNLKVIDKFITTTGKATGLSKNKIIELLRSDKISKEALEIIAKLRDHFEKENPEAIKGVLQKSITQLEIELINHPLINQKWALEQLMKHRQISLDEIKNPELKEQYRQQLLDQTIGQIDPSLEKYLDKNKGKNTKEKQHSTDEDFDIGDLPL